jgi:hypothetical protein
MRGNPPCKVLQVRLYVNNNIAKVVHYCCKQVVLLRWKFRAEVPQFCEGGTQLIHLTRPSVY